MTDENQLPLFSDAIEQQRDQVATSVMKVITTVFKDKNPTQDEIEAIKKTIARNARVLKMTGVPEDQAEETAADEYLKALITKSIKNVGIGQTSKMVKEYLKEKYGKRSSACAQDAFEWAKKHRGYEAKGANGIGDALGRGGLFLEEIGRGSQKEYKIPSPEQFASWYANHEEMLPMEYYSDAGFEKLRKAEAPYESSRFLEWHGKE